MDPRSDKELVDEALHGDEAALANLVERHLPGVYAFVFRLTGREEVAEDAAQETFVKVWRNLARYDSFWSFRTWLYNIARNASIDLLRKRRETLFSELESDERAGSFAENLPDNAALPSELAARAEDARHLAEVMEELPLPQQEVLHLHYIDGFTFEEIGNILGQSNNTVKSRHRRAIEKLRSSLDLRERK